MTRPHRLPPFDGDAYDREVKLARRQRKPTDKKPEGLGRALPAPRQTAKGRWKVQFVHRGVRHKRTFDTKAEAEQYIRQIKRGA